MVPLSRKCHTNQTLIQLYLKIFAQKTNQKTLQTQTSQWLHIFLDSISRDPTHASNASYMCVHCCVIVETSDRGSVKFCLDCLDNSPCSSSGAKRKAWYINKMLWNCFLRDSIAGDEKQRYFIVFSTVKIYRVGFPLKNTSVLPRNRPNQFSNMEEKKDTFLMCK